MRLVDVEHLFDGSKIIFYFTADERVDFRALVRDLAAKFHTRIEMRQIGVTEQGAARGRDRLLRTGTLLLHVSDATSSPSRSRWPRIRTSH